MFAFLPRCNALCDLLSLFHRLWYFKCIESSQNTAISLSNIKIKIRTCAETQMLYIDKVIFL